ncbi:hypothetical protein AVEN_216115-1, partial [Araneus ventricosus]
RPFWDEPRHFEPETIPELSLASLSPKFRTTPEDVWLTTYDLALSYRTRRSRNFPLTTAKAGMRRLASFEGRGVSEIAEEISALGGPIVLAHHSPFAYALREDYCRGWGVNDHPGWASSIPVVSSQKGPVLKGLEEKRHFRIKELTSNRSSYTVDFQWNRVSNLEPSGPEAETRPPRPCPREIVLSYEKV